MVWAGIGRRKEDEMMICEQNSIIPDIVKDIKHQSALEIWHEAK